MRLKFVVLLAYFEFKTHMILYKKIITTTNWKKMNE